MSSMDKVTELLVNSNYKAPTMAEHNFAPLQNDNLLRAARGEKPDRIPVWIMRQAGRHLPEFREFRKEHDFMSICRNAKWATEVTLQPVRRYDLDAAIIFSDILTIPDAMGLELQMIPGKGPVFTHKLDLANYEKQLDLNINSVCDKCQYVNNAITECRTQLAGKIPLIGFSGAPFTLLTYMIEGESSKVFSKSRAAFYQNKKDFGKMIQILSDIIVEYCRRQIDAGAQLIQLFESHALYICPEMSEMMGNSIISICNRLKETHPDVPLTVFAKDASKSLIDILNKCGNIDCFSIDWNRTGEEARNAYASNGITNYTLQGNLDPCVLYAEGDVIEEQTRKMIKSFGSKNYISNLGHGIYLDMPIEGVLKYIETVHSIKIE